MAFGQLRDLVEVLFKGECALEGLHTSEIALCACPGAHAAAIVLFSMCFFWSGLCIALWRAGDAHFMV